MLRRTRFSHLDADGWRQAMKAAPALPPGATPGFLDAVAGALNDASGEALVCESSRGRVALPVVRWAGMALAMPFGMPGGPVVLDGEAFALEPGAMLRELEAQKLIVVVHHTRAADYVGAAVASTYATHLIGVEADVRGNYRQRVRRKLRSAEQAGIEVSLGGPGDVERLIEILTAAAAGAGRELYPAAEVVRATALAPEAVVLLGAQDGEEISAALLLDSPLELFYWLGGTLPRAAGLSPSFAVIDAAASIAADRGRRWLNLGSSKGAPGVAHFKRGFGARETTYPALEAG